jgi:hypothetical protein
MGQGDPGGQHQALARRTGDIFHESLRCTIFSGRMSESGQFLPPSLATAMEELARRPDANAPNRRSAL